MSLFEYQQTKPVVAPSAFVAPNAVLIGHVTVSARASVWFGSVLRGDEDRIVIGEETNIQDLTMCHADPGTPLQVGRRITVGHRCILHGCTIEDECLIGMGAIVMNEAIIGRGSIVAAGSVILEKTIIPQFSLVAGVPGKVKRTLPEEEALAAIGMATQVYVDRTAKYRSGETFHSSP